MTNHTDQIGVLVYELSLPNSPRSGRPPSRLRAEEDKFSTHVLRGLDIPESIEGSGTCLCGSLDCKEGNKTHERPADQSARLAHPVGHNGQECRTADSGQFGDISRAENHDDVEHPTQGTGTNDSDEDGNGSGDGGPFHFLTDMGGY